MHGGNFYMESMNKFKVLTVIIICMFIFAVAAIYSNTKEASLKTNKQQITQQVPEKDVNETGYANEDFAGVVRDIDSLNKKVDELTDKINNSEDKENVVKCKILGTLTGDAVEEAAPNNAIQEAKDNGVPLVITCKL